MDFTVRGVTYVPKTVLNALVDPTVHSALVDIMAKLVRKSVQHIVNLASITPFVHLVKLDGPVKRANAI